MKSKNRTTFANVVSVAALIVATAGAGGGVAYAHGKIGSAQLKANAVKSKHVKNNNLKSKDIKNGNLRGVDVKNGSLGAQDLNGKTASGLNVVGIHGNSNGSTRSWFNRVGGAPQVSKTGAGRYRIYFPGATPDANSIVQVSTWNNNGRCSAGHTSVGGNPGFYVNCFDAGTTTYSDKRYYLTYVN